MKLISRKTIKFSSFFDKKNSVSSSFLSVETNSGDANTSLKKKQFAKNASCMKQVELETLKYPLQFLQWKTMQLVLKVPVLIYCLYNRKNEARINCFILRCFQKLLN